MTDAPVEKFGRKYRLIIDPADDNGIITIELPFTIRFWIQRDVMASLNHMSIEIYNLGEETRNRIFQDKYERRNKSISLEVGYQSLSRVFVGELWQAGTYRNGPNLITRIESMTGHFDTASSTVNKTIGGGRTIDQIIYELTGSFENLTSGNIRSDTTFLPRPVTLSGNTWDILKAYTDNKCFIDNNEICVLHENDVTDDEILVLDAATGLLDVPKRDEGVLTIRTMLEPNVKVGSRIQLYSTVQPVYNGQYKVNGLTHQGIISDSVNGVSESVFKLYVGSYTFSVVEHAKQ